jgi:hypothetical protein
MTSTEQMTGGVALAYFESMTRLKWISKHTDPEKLEKASKVRAAVLLYRCLNESLPDVSLEERTHWMTKGQVRFLTNREIFKRLTGEPDYRLRAVPPEFALANRYHPERGDTPLSVFILCENAGFRDRLYPGMEVLALRADKPIPGPRTGHESERIYLFGLFHAHEVDELLDPDLIIPRETLDPGSK